MPDENELVERAAYYVNARGNNRLVVMYGYHPDLQKKLELKGIKIHGIFTGNLELLANEKLGCINQDELKGKADKYYIILPFFLPDGGISQRERLEEYGYGEYKDYLFFPRSNYAVEEYALAEANKKLKALKQKNEELCNELNALKKTVPAQSRYLDMFTWYLSPQRGENELSAKKRFFLDLPCATGTARNMQLAGAILLSKLDSVCKENSITYWTSFGTLLGAVRHGGFIPWDDDTDVCMMRCDAIKLTEILKNDEDFYVSHIFAEFDDNLNHCVQLKFRKSAPYCLDIFIYDYCESLNKRVIDRQRELNMLMANEAQPIRLADLPKDEKIKQYSDLLNKYLEISRKEVGITDKPTNYMIWALDNFRCEENFQSNCAMNNVFPLKTISFEGLSLNAPRSPEEYLDQKYGDIYSLPGDILSHIHFKLNAKQEQALVEILKQYGHYLNQKGSGQ